jgi:hypothetical protein
MEWHGRRGIAWRGRMGQGKAGQASLLKWKRSHFGAAVFFWLCANMVGMVDLADIARRLHAIADEIAQADAGDWVDAWRSGDAISTDQAALISKCSTDTMRRRAETAAAEGQDLGVLHCGVNIPGRRRLQTFRFDRPPQVN